MKELGLDLEAAKKVAPLVMQDTGVAIAPYRITPARIAQMFEEAYEV